MGSADTNPPPAKNAVSRRVVFLLFILAGLVWLRDPVEFRIRLHKQLAAEVPETAYIDSLLDLPSHQFRAAVHALWQSRKIPHRQSAMRLLALKAALNQMAELPSFRPLLVEALSDCDSSLRENGLHLLVRIDGDGAREHLLAQLQDSDNHIRTMSMWHLRRLGVSNALPHIAAQLRDPDPHLAYESVQWLQRMTGVDHGMRSAWMTRNSELAADVTSGHNHFQLARQSAITWWNAHRSDYPVGKLPVLPPVRRSGSVDLQSVGLVRAARSSVDVSTLRNRPVLLYFFTSWNTFGMYGAEQVHEVAGAQMSVLAVALDAITDGHNVSHLARELGPPGSHSDPRADGPIPYPLAQVTGLVERSLEGIGFKLPVVYDVRGQLTRKLQGGEIPAYVLLDSEHRIVRRFAGPRRGETLVKAAIDAGLITNPDPNFLTSANQEGAWNGR